MHCAYHHVNISILDNFKVVAHYEVCRSVFTMHNRLGNTNIHSCCTLYSVCLGTLTFPNFLPGQELVSQ